MTRRRLLRVAATAGAALPAAQLLAACGSDSDGGSSRNAKAVTFAGYGGSINDAIQRAYADPFTRKTGIEVTLGANTSLALLKAQVESGNVRWDIVELSGSEYERAVEQDLLEPIDYDIVNGSAMPDYARGEFGIKYALFLFVAAWDQRKVPDASAPQTWADFWDTSRYEGKRAVHANLADGSTLEAALMADGVAPQDLYPLDVERALKSLDRLGADNMVFYEANQVPIQQLTSGELPLAMSFNGRVVPAQRDGAKIGFTPDQGVVTGSYLGVSKGSPAAEAAQRLIGFIASNAEGAAEYMRATSYASPNLNAVRLLPRDVAAGLPTNPALQDKIVVRDDRWWTENLETTQNRFKEWQLSL